MATPQEIATGAACFSCIPDKLAALLYLLATNAGMTDPQAIATASACYSCIPDKLAAILYLLDGGGGGGGGGGESLCGAVDPVAAPSGTCGLYFNTVAQSFWAWDGANWIQLIA
jgi:hypothetical protein